MLGCFRRVLPALTTCTLLACGAALGAQTFSGSALIGVTGQVNFGQPGQAASGGAGFDFAVLGNAGFSDHMGYALRMQAGYDRVGGYNGGQLEFEYQWLLAPKSLRTAASILPVFYVAAAGGVRLGAPFHVYAAPGVGLHLSLPGHVSRGSRRVHCGQSRREKAAKFRRAARPRQTMRRGPREAQARLGAGGPQAAASTSGARGAAALGPAPVKVPFVEVRRRFPLDSSHWSHNQVTFGVNFSIAD